MSEDPEKCKFHVKISFELIPEVSLLTGGAPDLIWGSRDWWPLWGQIGQVLGFYDYNIMSHSLEVSLSFTHSHSLTPLTGPMIY